MKKLFLPLVLISIVTGACSKDDDVIEKVAETEKINPADIEVESFIYAGMNEVYLYKADVPTLADNHFTSSSEKAKFLAGFDSPEKLYESLQPEFDEFSFMHHDYEELEKYFSGVSKSNGMDYQLSYIQKGSNALIGYVRYVLPNTSAAEQGIKRGDIFTEVNGIKLNDQNYQSLLSGESYTIDINRLENGEFTSTGNTISLVSTEYTEDPVHYWDVLEIEGRKIGYLVYNGFTGTNEFDSKLNSVFLEFKNAGISNLILDLRYNGGGSVETAVDLAGMITGQFENKIFIKEYWNNKYQNAWPAESYLTRFDSTIRTDEPTNSLQLQEVTVIATRSSASASELIINGLEPHIDVIHVGDTTRGKFQASTTLYDSPNFWKYDDNDNWHVNPNHKYVIQPLIFKSANADGKTDFVDGLFPDVTIEERLSDYGVLGDPNEPLLKAAINHIFGNQQETASAFAKRAEETFRYFGEKGMKEPTFQRMYTDRPLKKTED